MQTQCAGSARYSERAGTHSADVRARQGKHDYAAESDRSTRGKRSNTLGVIAWWRGDYWSAVCDSCRYGVGPTTGIPRRNWDSHEDLKRDHGPLAAGLGIGASALIKDLKQRGMLDDTIVLWTTEFGRMPCNQGANGRDHNPFVFTNWLAGGGVKGGVSYGESDEWSYKPLDRRQADVLLRRSRHRHAPVGYRAHRANVPPQRHRAPAHRCARRGNPAGFGVRETSWRADANHFLSLHIDRDAWAPVSETHTFDGTSLAPRFRRSNAPPNHRFRHTTMKPC